MRRSQACLIFVIAIAFVMVLTGCAADRNPLVDHTGTAGTAGFWLGLWHGIILPVMVFVSMFFDTGIYQVHNSGGWYNFGFLIGLSMILGGGGRGAAGRN
jgi:predicted phage tail protein